MRGCLLGALACLLLWLATPGFAADGARVGQVLELLTKSGIEYEFCRGVPEGGDGEGVSCAFHPGSLDRLEAFYQKVLAMARANVRRLVVQAGPAAMRGAAPAAPGAVPLRVELDLVLASDLGVSSPSRLLDLMGPAAGLPLFVVTDGEAPTEPALLDFHWDASAGALILVAGPEVGALQEFARARGLPGRSRSISRSRFGARDLYNLDFSSHPTHFRTGDLLGLFAALQKHGRIDAISLEPQVGRERRVRIAAAAAALAVSEILGLLRTSAGMQPEELVARPGEGGQWRMTLIVRPAAGVAGAGSGAGSGADRFIRLLTASWPDPVPDDLEVSWSPIGVRVRCQVDDGSAVATVGHFDALGLRQSGRREVAGADEGAGRRVELTFNLAGGDAAAGTPGTSGPADGVTLDLTGLGEVTGEMEISGGRRLEFSMPVTRRRDLRDRLSRLPATVDLAYFDLRPMGLAAGATSGPRQAEAGPGPAMGGASGSGGAGDRDRRRVVVELRAGASAVGRRRRELAIALLGGAFGWEPAPPAKGQAGLVGMELDSTGGFTLRGVTLSSGLIFSQLLPALKRLPMVAELSFSAGQYFDHPEGRAMNFQLLGKQKP